MYVHHSRQAEAHQHSLLPIELVGATVSKLGTPLLDIRYGRSAGACIARDGAVLQPL